MKNQTRFKEIKGDYQVEVMDNPDLNKQTNVETGLFKEQKELQPFALTQKECFVSTIFVSLEN